MRLVRHPNIVQLYEVMASKTKIYFAMEYVTGGELFSKVAKGKLKEDVARKYFQQLIGAVDFCHSRGVYHRDIKPENLLLDVNGNLKISDFGLTALWDSRKQDGLLHTTCGTPAYVAPEVITKNGYDGAKSDIWKIIKGEFKCPNWINSDARKLLSRILHPNPSSRISIDKIMSNSWFKKGYKQIETPPSPQGQARCTLLKDVHEAFDSSLPSEGVDNSQKEVAEDARSPVKPIITMPLI
ncbi:hypothetical protein GH714_003852 [Hevea brasiliensis]|uniref:Protein kinase domain-containing protein n=1 Tax=Hevea brasiliensis TaxID=3981 RepID=A0A6A6M9N1_HEVBR|nr:hypothetical protein GH714_003852 [Hevea brasiliensis]